MGLLSRSKPTDDIPDSIKLWERGKGGWRYDENERSIYLPWDHLLLFERTSLATQDDDEFWNWFKEYRKEHNLTSGGGAWRSTDTIEWEDKKKGKYLSSWWASDVHKSWSGSSESSYKLATALKAVRSVVRVVDDSNPPMSVDWADTAISATSFGDNKIIINPQPVTDTKTDDGDAIDVTTGFALHEASHSQYSREPYETLKSPTEVSPLTIGAMLLNFVEDVLIERKTSEQFPGFAGYFDKALEWTWEGCKKNAPKEYGPKLNDKLNAVIAICRWPDKVAKVLKDPSFAAEIPWWSNWRDDYLDGRVGARETIERGLAHLAEDPDTKAEMDAIAEREKEMKEFGEAIEQIIEQLGKEIADQLGIKPCASDDGPQKTLRTSEHREVTKMVDEDYTKEQVYIQTPSGSRMPPIHIDHPAESDESKRAYIGKPNPVLQRLKGALVFRQELPRFTTRLLKRGGLDEEELWRWADKDYRVFNEDVIAARPKVQFSLLIDMSGSMSGKKLRTAQELGQLMVWALKDMEGVHTKVFGHTGDLTTEYESTIHRLWEPGEPLTRLGLTHALPQGDNYDGYAIEWVARELIARTGPDEQMVLLVLSDGYPAGQNYGHLDAEEHVGLVTRWAEKQGVAVIQIAIDPSIRPANQARMFRQFIQFDDLASVPTKLARLLAKLT